MDSRFRGPVHTEIGTAANVNDVTQADALLHGAEDIAIADAGYQGAGHRAEGLARNREQAGAGRNPVNWQVAMKLGKRRNLDPGRPLHAALQALEKAKARLRARVEHPFRVLKR